MRGLRILAAPIAVVLAVAGPTAAEETTLEELERRLDAAVRAEQRATPRKTTLQVISGLHCTLQIDGVAHGEVETGAPRLIPLPPGDHAIECRGEAGTLRKSVTLSPGLAGSVDFSAQRFLDAGAGTIRDTQTQVLWTQADTGQDTDWNAAQAGCNQRGAGWRLPSVDELRALVGKPREFSLSGALYWSADPNGSAQAWALSLAAGERQSYARNDAAFMNALCVRSP